MISKQRPNSPTQTLLTQSLMAILLGITLFFILILGAILGYQLLYAGRIYPGIAIAGIDVGGLPIDQAAEKIAQSKNYAQNGTIILHQQQESWVLSPMELGLFIDPTSSAQQAFQIGRKGFISRLQEQFFALYNGYDLPLTLLYDQNMTFQFLESIRQQIDIPVIEADLEIKDIEVIVHTGQNGKTLDMNNSLNTISQQLITLQDGIIELKVHETPAAILDASQQAQIAQEILSQPLILTLPENHPNRENSWTIEPQDLANMLNIERVTIDNNNEEFQITLNSDLLRQFLYSNVHNTNINAENARYIFNDDTRLLEVIQSSVTGLSLDVETSIKNIQSNIINGQHTIPLTYNQVQPELTDQTTGEEIGVRELVHAETSYFYGSSPERVQNIVAAAEKFHGIAIPPGSTFSMAEALGDVSLDNGFAEALIIYGDQTIKGVGGGVCQVSTTLFRTAFFAGFPIVERIPHAYRVYYYEKTAGNKIDPNLAGLDATVFVPLVDFKFTNDTPHWLLMETYVYPSYSSITWKFYSTSENRNVEWHTTGPQNIVPEPEPLYKENPELPEGKIEQVDWGVDGADVTVSRTVYNADSSVHFQDSFSTHYKPWRDIFEYGPGTEGIPTPEAEHASEENTE